MTTPDLNRLGDQFQPIRQYARSKGVTFVQYCEFSEAYRAQFDDNARKAIRRWQQLPARANRSHLNLN